MKTTTSLLTLASIIAAPALAALLFDNQTFPTDLLLGSYSIAGLLFIAATDYTPNRPLVLPRVRAKSTISWTRRLPASACRSRRVLRAEKTTA